jgi:hypothetical protein
MSDESVTLGAVFSAVLEEFTSYLADERRRLPYTVRAYRKDVRLFLGHASVLGASTLAHLDLRHFRAWLGELDRTGLARATIARRAATVRSFMAGVVGERWKWTGAVPREARRTHRSACGPDPGQGSPGCPRRYRGPWPPFPTAQRRDAPARQWSRPALRPGTARSLQPWHHAALRACVRRPAPA